MDTKEPNIRRLKFCSRMINKNAKCFNCPLDMRLMDNSWALDNDGMPCCYKTNDKQTTAKTYKEDCKITIVSEAHEKVSSK